ncbi:MAG: cytochrome c maturation protein CcmE [Thermomicrobiales bacterium]
MAESVLGRPRVVGAMGAQRGRRGSKRWQLAIVLLVIASAVGYLVYSGLRTNVYYQTVSELQASGGAHGRQVRVAGDVVDGSIVREEGSSVVHFQITDGTGGTLPVTYSGAVPDIFGPGIQVVVEGKYHSDTGFTADTMLAKCPSKFAAATPGQ